jgi:hypothetical protein
VCRAIIASVPVVVSSSWSLKKNAMYCVQKGLKGACMIDVVVCLVVAVV